MAQTFLGQKRLRKYYGKIREVLDMPNLIEVQMSSYDQFLNSTTLEGERADVGITEVFKSVFPIVSYSGNAALEYVDYAMGKPIFDDGARAGQIARIKKTKARRNEKACYAALVALTDVAMDGQGNLLREIGLRLIKVIGAVDKHTIPANKPRVQH